MTGGDSKNLQSDKVLDKGRSGGRGDAADHPGKEPEANDLRPVGEVVTFRGD